MKTVTIYTDGSCINNPGGPGGWGAILIYGDAEKEISGGEYETTNNRMEMMAVIQALSALKEPCIVELWSDSAYVLDALKKGWVKRWKRNGWMRNENEAALNPDLWDKLLHLTSIHSMRYHWVKGHSSNPYNNRCDKMALTQSRKLFAELTQASA